MTLWVPNTPTPVFSNLVPFTFLQPPKPLGAQISIPQSSTRFPTKPKASTPISPPPRPPPKPPPPQKMPPASGRRNSLTPVPPNDTSHDSADDDYFTRLERPDLPSSPAAPQHASKRSPSHTRSPRRWDHGSFDRTDPDPDPSPPWWRRSRWLPPLLLTLLLARYRSQLLLHIRSLLTKHRHKLPLLAAALPSFPALPSFLRRPPPRPQPNQTPLPLSALLSPSPSSLSLTSSYAQLPNGRVNYPSHLLPTLVKSLLSSNSPPSIAFPPPAQPNAILSNALAVLIPVGYVRST